MPTPSALPDKRYFTIGEVATICGVRSHVLRYWEQEFTQLKPVKRRGNRRYYQHHEVLLIQRIRTLLYEEGFTIQGARAQLAGSSLDEKLAPGPAPMVAPLVHDDAATSPGLPPPLRQELEAVLQMLRGKA